MKQLKNKREIFEVKEEQPSILQFTYAAFGARYCIILLSDSLPLASGRQKSNFVLRKTKIPFKISVISYSSLRAKGEQLLPMKNILCGEDGWRANVKVQCECYWES